MAIVRLELTPSPAQVRTARLVAAAVARRCGVDDSLLDEIRLAVGEACSRAVGRHRAHSRPELVRLEMEDGGPFTVEVSDVGPAPDHDDPGAGLDPAEDGLPPGAGLALLSGLVEDVQVSAGPGGGGTTVRMSWPVVEAPRRR